MKKTMKNKKGGIFNDSLPGKNTEETFYDLIQNSSITYLSKGANGLIFKVVVKPGYTSSYKYIYSDSFNKPVTELILKLTLMMDFDEKNYSPEDLPDLNDYDKNEIENFKNEINVQTDIFLGSIEYLQPLCPSIVYSDILYNKESKEKFINTLIHKNPQLKQSKIPFNGLGIELKSDTLKQDNIKLGIIAMECATGYRTLWNIVNDKRIDDETKILYVNYSLYVILKLALDFGYTHGDYHSGNIMINPDITYFNGLKGRAMLIDFGYASLIKPIDKNIIINFVKEKKYIKALKHLCSVERADGETPGREEWNNFYGWICHDWDILKGQKSTSKTNNSIKHTSDGILHTLFESRKVQTNILVEESLLKHDSNNEYPLLPFDPHNKRRMFHGIHGGRQNKIMKKTKKKQGTRKSKTNILSFHVNNKKTKPIQNK